MDSAVIHFFSGTGNTMRAAALISEELELSGIKCTMVNTDSTGGAAAPVGTLEIFMFPVYGFAVPKSMLDYMKSLRPVKGTRAAIIPVGGTQGKDPGFAGASSYQAEALLKKKGYDIGFIDFISYPENWTLMFNPADNEEAARVYSVKDPLAQNMASVIASGQTYINKCNTPNYIWSKIVGWAFRGLGGRMLGKAIIADEKCNTCRLCEKTCPTKAIHMYSGKPRWNWHCQQCNRCVNICPRKAIQTSILRLVLLIAAIPASITIVSALPDKMTNITGMRVVDTIYQIVLVTALYFLLYYVVDKILHVLEQIPAFRKFSSLSFTKNYNRYTAPGFKPFRRN